MLDNFTLDELVTYTRRTFHGMSASQLDTLETQLRAHDHLTDVCVVFYVRQCINSCDWPSLDFDRDFDALMRLSDLFFDGPLSPLRIRCECAKNRGGVLERCVSPDDLGLGGTR